MSIYKNLPSVYSQLSRWRHKGKFTYEITANHFDVFLYKKLPKKWNWVKIQGILRANLCTKTRKWFHTNICPEATNAGRGHQGWGREAANAWRGHPGWGRETANAGRGHPGWGRQCWTRPSRMRPPMLDEAILDGAANAGRGHPGWGCQCWMRPSRKRPPMLVEAPMLDENTIGPNHNPEFS